MRIFRRDIREGNEELTFRQESGLNGSSLVPVSEAIPGVSREEEFRARLSKRHIGITRCGRKELELTIFLPTKNINGLKSHEPMFYYC